MKFWKIAAPGCVPALLKLETEEGKPLQSIVIGEHGRGRKEVIIPISENGPEIGAKKIGDSIVLVRGDKIEDDRCLAVINTTGQYKKFKDYKVFDAIGVQIIATGYVAWGEAGGTEGGEEVLAIISSGASFRLNSKYAQHWYYWSAEKGWTMETPEEREARFALTKAEQGEGEWL
ncbi:MAG: hypothetical protein WA091_02750 [Minisyncoccales bacterium]